MFQINAGHLCKHRRPNIPGGIIIAAATAAATAAGAVQLQGGPAGLGGDLQQAYLQRSVPASVILGELSSGDPAMIMSEEEVPRRFLQA